MSGRRQNVRVRPCGDYPIVIDYGSSFVRVQLPILDIAVGGVGLEVLEHIRHVEAGSELALGVTLPGVARFETVASVRYAHGGVGGRCGVHFDRLTGEQQTALSRAVSELLERGMSV